MPTVYGAATVDGWAVLVLEDLTSADWPPPYADGGEALLESVKRVADTTPPPGLERRPEGRPYGTYWQRIADDPEPVLAHGLFSATWLEKAQPILHAAESAARLAGDDFLHDDVWHGNVCYAERGAVLIDWASAQVGDHRVDLAYALLSIRSTGANRRGSTSPTGRIRGAARRRQRVPGSPARRSIDQARIGPPCGLVARSRVRARVGVRAAGAPVAAT